MGNTSRSRLRPKDLVKSAIFCVQYRALVAVGCFAILSSAVGYAGAHFRPFFLMLYLIVGTVSTTLQLLIVLGIFGAQDRVADEIIAADSSSGVQHFDRCCTLMP